MWCNSFRDTFRSVACLSLAHAKMMPLCLLQRNGSFFDRLKIRRCLQTRGRHAHMHGLTFSFVSGFTTAWLAEVESRMPTLSSSVLACCAWALATLGGPPPPTPWMRTLCLVLPQRLDAMSAQEVAMLAWALGELRHGVRGCGVGVAATGGQ